MEYHSSSTTRPNVLPTDRSAGGAASPLAGIGRAVRVAWLIGLVHLDAFRASPLGYLQAVAWRVRGLRVRSRNRIAPLAGRSSHAYQLWMARREPELRAQFASAAGADDCAILPVIDCRRRTAGLESSLQSIAGAGSRHPPLLLGAHHPGLTTLRRPDELRSAVGAQGAWICPMEPGDQLAPGALRAYAAAIEGAPRPSIVYGDDDLIDPSGRRHSPHFKPQWNPDLFECHDFITGACVAFVPADLDPLPERDWATALVRLAFEGGAAPLHVPLVLHHRAKRPEPRATAPPPPLAAERAPLVSIVIPTRNQVELLRNCLEGVLRADYPAFETIIVDNGSEASDALEYLSQLESQGLRVLRMPGPFNFSKLNNAAVEQCQGSMLCFLNNDVETLDQAWLSTLVPQALRLDIGAVGARLLYPDRTIQHAGVYLGIGGGAGHGHRFLHVDDFGYFARAKLPQLVSAVTAACMVVQRSKFIAVSGFDETDFPIAFNDVDLCLKLGRQGWQSFYEPRATLIHHESKSRGSDHAKSNRVRFAGELAALKRKWNTDRMRDPFHHPHLSPYSEQFVVAI